MWAVYNVNSLQVMKTVFSKKEAERLAEYYNKPFRYSVTLPYSYEEFPEGELDKWVVTKTFEKWSGE